MARLPVPQPNMPGQGPPGGRSLRAGSGSQKSRRDADQGPWRGAGEPPGWEWKPEIPQGCGSGTVARAGEPPGWEWKAEIPQRTRIRDRGACRGASLAGSEARKSRRGHGSVAVFARVGSLRAGSGAWNPAVWIGFWIGSVDILKKIDRRSEISNFRGKHQHRGHRGAEDTEEINKAVLDWIEGWNEQDNPSSTKWPGTAAPYSVALRAGECSARRHRPCQFGGRSGRSHRLIILRFVAVRYINCSNEQAFLS